MTRGAKSAGGSALWFYLRSVLLVSPFHTGNPPVSAQCWNYQYAPLHPAQMPLDVLFKLSSLYIVEREPGPGRTVIPASSGTAFPSVLAFLCISWSHWCMGDFTWPGQNPSRTFSAVSPTLDHLSWIEGIYVAAYCLYFKECMTWSVLLKWLIGHVFPPF